MQNVFQYILMVKPSFVFIKSILRGAMKPDLHYALDAELTLRVGDTLLANAKRIELLRQIGLTENLTRAAGIAGYSYKGAWDTIEQMTQLTGGSLLERHAGGRGGGRTRLTERGRQLLANFMLIQGEHARFIARLNRVANGLDADYAVQTGIAMTTSARNQFGALIVSVARGPVNDQIGLMIDGRLLLIASITHDSSTDLKLETGAKVFALIKASSVELHPAGYVKSAPCNVVEGSVRSLTRGEQRSEISIAIDEGPVLVCTVSNPQVDTLRLDIASRVSCVIDASNIMLAVAA
jgi:molybdate transport system regulatory protein